MNYMQHWRVLLEQVWLVLKEYPMLRITPGRKVKCFSLFLELNAITWM